MAHIDLHDDKTVFNFVVRDGNGIKGLVDRGLSQVPGLFIQPSKERIDKTKAIINQTPPIDLSKLDGPDHDQVVNDIVAAAETIGFFQVVNHGVPTELLESLKVAARNFFSQPLEMKAMYGQGVSPLVRYGTSFLPGLEEALEWKDLISMLYTSDDEALQYWPEECKYAAIEYVKIATKMIKKLLQILMREIGVSEDVDSKIETLIAVKRVNMNFYPPCPDPDVTVGIQRHSDICALTVLLQDGIGGLYVKVDEEAPGEWMEIPPIPGALVVNVGDTLQIVSNGRYKSAEHRVRTTSKKSRVSVPLFVFPNPTEMIGPFPEVVQRDGLARYRDVLFQDYMTHYFTKIPDGKKSLDFMRI